MLVKEGEDSSDAIYSISEGEGYMEMLREEGRTWWIGPKSGYRAMVQVSQKQYECEHIWKLNEEVDGEYEKCHCCKTKTQQRHRRHCPLCKITICGMCSIYYYNKKTPVAQSTSIRYDPKGLLREQQNYISHCEAEIKRLKLEIEARHEKEKEVQQTHQRAINIAEENLRLLHEIESWKIKYQKLEEEAMELDSMILEKEDLQKEIKRLKEERDNHKEKNIIEEPELNVLLLEDTQKVLSLETQEVSHSPRKVKSMLFNLKIEFDIPTVPPFKVNAILDTDNMLN